MAKHILSVLVENRAGVLSKVAGLFSRRGFNIHSLAVGTTEDEKISRITIVAEGDEYTIEQLGKQLNKLIDVIKIRRLDKESCVSRELALIKVKATEDKRSGIIQITDIFRAKIVDVSAETLTVEITGDEDKFTALSDMLKPFGIIEMVRTGAISIERGEKSFKAE